MEKINKLKKLIKNENIDGYIVPKNDEFFCEYIQENKDRLKYISNFSGSFGFALILQEKNYLFVDGRYTLQANKQSKKKFIIKTIPGVLPQNILKGKKFRIGYDPKLFTKKSLSIFFSKTNCKYIPINRNLKDKIWLRKHNISLNKFYTLPQHSAEQNYKQKINTIIFLIKK